MTITYTRSELETALDNSTLFAKMHNGREWRLRRNGKTQTWKRDPNRFRIPVKAGLRSCGAIDETNMNDNYWVIK